MNLSFNDDQSTYLNQNFKDIECLKKVIDSKEFDNCIFNGCNFSETEFYKCKFYECKFVNCNLSTINVRSTSFFDTIFEDSKMIGIDWNRAEWPRIKLSSPIQFYKCILNDSSFFGLSLRELVIVECSAHSVDFREADCSEADFSSTDFTDSLFNKTNLTKANFRDAINYNINIFFNETKKAKFSLPEAMNLLRHLDIELVDID
ncbi:MAG: pentapeptide repeat-containing protein [Proteobacteria bacterium]|nr:pentapeptide repeat-containing protein [Pseudomonadota bacterium]